MDNCKAMREIVSRSLSSQDSMALKKRLLSADDYDRLMILVSRLGKGNTPELQKACDIIWEEARSMVEQHYPDYQGVDE
jgi:hypothetical protein